MKKKMEERSSNNKQNTCLKQIWKQKEKEEKNHEKTERKWKGKEKEGNNQIESYNHSFYSAGFFPLEIIKGSFDDLAVSLCGAERV